MEHLGQTMFKIALIIAGHSSSGDRAALDERVNGVNCQKMTAH